MQQQRGAYETDVCGVRLMHASDSKTKIIIVLTQMPKENVDFVGFLFGLAI